MTQSDALNAGMAQLSTDLAAVATAIQTEIQQLADAVAAGADAAALSTAAQNAIAGLQTAHDSLTALQTSLAADDPTP
jgi:hypothetical protein